MLNHDYAGQNSLTLALARRTPHLPAHPLVLVLVRRVPTSAICQSAYVMPKQRSSPYIDRYSQRSSDRNDAAAG